MANQFLALSLFLMLLSFFIVMNSISSYENHKTYPVLNSLSLAFSTKDPVKYAASIPEPGNMTDTNRGDSLESLDGLFNTHIAGFKPRINRLGTVMHVAMPISRFENTIDFDGFDNNRVADGGRGSFAQTMISILRSEQGGRTFRVDLFLNTPEEPSDYALNQRMSFMRDLKRVSALAQRLERAGMPVQSVSAGLRMGETSMLDIFIRRYEPLSFGERDITITGDNESGEQP